MIQISGLFGDQDHIITETKGMFSIVEHTRDLTVSPMTAMMEYYMSKMEVRRKQILCEMNGDKGVIVQAGAMQWMAGDISATTGIKGVGDFVGKVAKGWATKESAIKPEYVGSGYLMLEPTYKYLLLEDVSDWEDGLVLEDGMFLAAENTVKLKIQARSNASSAFLGNEGLFNLKLTGHGAVALESYVMRSQLVEVVLDHDVLKVDGNMAVCWSGSLDFTVERSGKTLIGSAVSGEGLVNVYRGTGKVLLSTLDDSSSLFASTNTKSIKHE